MKQFRQETQSSLLQLIVTQCVNDVAVTDLFPLTNQCPHQAIRPHTDQSEAECIDSFFLSRIIFSSPFWKSRQVTERTQLTAKTDLPCFLCYRHSTWKTFTEEHAPTSNTHRRTNLAAHHTSYLPQWHASDKLKDQHTNRRHQKESFLTLARLLLLL